MTPQSLVAVPALAAIAAAQAEQPIFAYDRGEVHRTLPRLQRVYATKLAQLEALAAMFDETTPDIVLQAPTCQLTFRLASAASGVYTELRKALDEELRALESDIVNAHLAIEQSAHYWATRPAPTPTESEYYIPYIVALCQPAPLMAPPAVAGHGLSREQVAQRQAAAEARAEAEAAREHPADAGARRQAAYAIGAQYLWHPAFAEHFPHQLAALDLSDLGPALGPLLHELNGGRALDAHDFGYVAEVLRAALAHGPLPSAHQSVAQALAWVEHAGAALLSSPAYSAAA